jgi:hypothetical protein
MWREVHDQIVEVGAAFITLLDELPPDLDDVPGDVQNVV